MDHTSSTHNNPSQTPSATQPAQVPQDPLQQHSLSPELSALIKTLVDSQVEQRVQGQAQQAEERISMKWKATFDEEWNKRVKTQQQQEEEYRRKLQEAETARAALEEQLRSNLEAQEAYITAQEQVAIANAAHNAAREVSMAPPEQIPLPKTPPAREQNLQPPPLQAPQQTPNRLRKRLFEAPIPPDTPTRSHTPQRGRAPQRAGAHPSRRQRQHRTRSASPTRRRDESQGPPVAATSRRANAASGPSQLRDQDVDMEEDDDEYDDGVDESEQGDKKGGRRKEYQLKSVDLPDDIAGFKESFMTHIRLLLRLPSSKGIPAAPPEASVQAFNDRFDSSAAVERHAQSPTLLVSVNEVRCATSVANSEQRNSKVLRIIRRMDDHILLYIDTCLAKYGLTEWCPDWNQPPSYLYNSVHKMVAIDTFRQAATSHAYASLKPNLHYVQDMGLLVNLYHHIVHYYFKHRYTRELLNPGSIAAEEAANPGNQRRIRLAKARRKWLEDQRLHRYCELIDPKSTSDDEQDPEGKKIRGLPLFFIKTRPERSAAATRFFRLLDAAREQDIRDHPSRNWKERARRDPKDPIPTDFTSIPVNMPADYFDPAFYNKLAPMLRMKAARQTVTFLPEIEQSFTFCEDEFLTEKDFTAKHGGERLTAYEFFEDEYDGDDDGEVVGSSV